MSVLGLVATMAMLSSSPQSMSLPQGPLGVFEGQTDVGKARPGSAAYDPAHQSYTIAGSGQNMWADHDDFHFVWKRMKGDFILTARGHLLGKGVEEHRKFGWQVRAGLDTGSPHATLVAHGNGLISLQWRRTAGAQTEQDTFTVRGTDVLELERRGDTYIARVARWGDTLTATQVTGVALGDDVYVGLFVCAHNDTVTEHATFDDVRITRPAPQALVPYRDYLGGQLEVMDVATGERRLLYSSKDAIQAPNWTHDGKALIYNANGRLYRFDLAKGAPSELNTGFATNNNNDHVLSFDGRMIGISNHVAEDKNNSHVFTVSVKGGTPTRVTTLGPSYLHGWSPDGKYLVYTGGRDNEYDIYRIAVTGGEELRLTTTKGLDDGPEYSPDGKYIYFNSTRTGTMQLWRMKPDGSDPEQLTHDGFNNWFPHVSPDGRTLVFLSYLPDVAPSDHPWYKHVYIRTMPAAGGEARVLAYVYGGQGTINVPSWSPDGKRVAFVSNTRMD